MLLPDKGQDGLVTWFYVHCIKATNALVGTEMCWVLSTTLSFPDVRGGCAPPGAHQCIQGWFLKTLIVNVL